MKRSIKFYATAILMIGGLALMFNSCNQEDELIIDEQDQIQTDFNLGCNLLPVDEYQALPKAKADLSYLKSAPISFNLETPPVGNQGGEGSCVAWGTTYAARSIEWQSVNGGTWSYSTNIFSPEFVYDQIKISDCGSGSYVTSGLNLLVNQGVCTWTTMPYSDSNGCDLIPNSTQQAEAAIYKVLSWSTVANNPDAIKAQLLAGNPVIVAGPVTNDYMYLADGNVLERKKGRTLGGHCYCVVGYDDTVGAFKFLNSWGTNWASSGYGWISYDFVTSWFQELYILN